MVWDPAQRKRLALEKETLEKYFRHGVTWVHPQHETKVEVLLISNSDREYKLRIYIPPDFPNSCPILVVVSPKLLLLKNGSRLPENSTPFHTLGDAYGFHRICHFYPPEWTSDITLYQVFMKGRLWIEAYEAHMETGEKMDAYLREQKNISVPESRLIAQYIGAEASNTTPRRERIPDVGNSVGYEHFLNELVLPSNRFERPYVGTGLVREPFFTDTQSNSSTTATQRPGRHSPLTSYSIQDSLDARRPNTLHRSTTVPTLPPTSVADIPPPLPPRRRPAMSKNSTTDQDLPLDSTNDSEVSSLRMPFKKKKKKSKKEKEASKRH